MTQDGVPGLPKLLIIDDSRIVRAAIIKRIRDRFEVREEGDGEAGWEALLVDPTIHLVITDQTMPRLDGLGLIQRIRASKVGRIRNIPIIMISGDEDESARQKAKDIGATDFITKGTGTAELLARLDALVKLGKANEELAEARADAATDNVSGLPSMVVFMRQADQIIAHARRNGHSVGVLVIGLDNYDHLVAQEGQGLADAIMARFAKVMSGAIRTEDSMVRWGAGCFAIVTPDADGAQARLFAERLRVAVAHAAIQHEGRTLRLTVTVGLAHAKEVTEPSPKLVLAIAEQRMLEGQRSGGNRIGDTGMLVPDSASIDGLLNTLAAGQSPISRSRLAAAGQRLLPLLAVLDKEFQLGISLADLEKKLNG